MMNIVEKGGRIVTLEFVVDRVFLFSFFLIRYLPIEENLWRTEIQFDRDLFNFTLVDFLSIVLPLLFIFFDSLASREGI